MKRFALLLLAVLVAVPFASPAGAASAVAAKYQLRGHLPELGEKPAIRVFPTQNAYDAYRSSLGEANVFPPASSMFMSFEKEILALYIRGNDSGGRCFGTAPAATLDGEAVNLELSWQAGTCGAPASAHYPFILVSLARAAADGTSWVTPARSVCGSAPGVGDSRACATAAGAPTPIPATPAPSPTPAQSPTPTQPPSPSPAVTAAPTATRTLTPTVPAATSPVAAASPTPAATVAATRSPVAAASPAVAGADTTPNYLLYGMLVAIGFLVGIALMLSRGSRRRR